MLVLAYAQGTDIHVGPGQEKHVSHEAWHVVQQAQGRVKPNMQMKSGVLVNDDKELEKEADVMGKRALQAVQRVGKSIDSVFVDSVDNRSEFIAQRGMRPKINEHFYEPIQLMKKWTQGGGFEDIEAAPLDEKWLRYKYKEEEIYINGDDLGSFNDWDNIDVYEESNEESSVKFEAEEEKYQEDEFPDFEVGEVTSITIIKESRSDHQYVIVMVKGGGNIKMHYGSAGGLYEKSNDIDNKHGVFIAGYAAPKGLTGDEVTQIFESTKEAIAEKFEGGNCGALATELVGKLGV